MAGLYTMNQETKDLISDISALSQYPKNLVKEVLEYMIIDWGVKIATSERLEEEYAELNIPFLGKMKIKYVGDEIGDDGGLKTIVKSEIELNDAFKKLVGDIHDQGISEITPLMQKKIRQSIMIACSDDVVKG